MAEQENEIVNREEELMAETATETVEAEANEEAEVNETDKLHIEITELKDKYLRLYADFENFRRRTAKEKIETISFANGELIKSLLPVVDDFERAMVSIENAGNIDAIKEGIVLVSNKFQKTLEAKGLKPMVSKGEVFDAELHESITQFAAPSDDLKGKVIEEIEKGYLLNDKVIRYAKVVVGM